ncbi:MAG: ParA family protein [Simkania sp.]|nr:ParA family protein [Simkania sp.]
MPVVTFCSFKGGTAKTSTALHLGACLAKYHKKKVLLIDFDAQANLSTGVGIEFDCLETMPLVLRGEKELKDIIRNTSIKHLDIAPANVYLDGIESTSPLAMDLYSHERLRKVLKGWEEIYDFIFIDTPPSLGWLTQSAFFASRYTVICVTPEPYSMLGLNRLREHHNSVKENHPLSCLGVLISFWDKQGSTNTAYLEAIEASFPNKVFEAKIRKDISITKAIFHGKPVFLTNEKARACQDYRSLGKEFLARLTHIQQTEKIETAVENLVTKKKPQKAHAGK